ncbi:ABC transporter substrate-binding protein [Clostridium polynesiense]|uniref:ABC transporter substrate-binding protein n=1 Tax=Clostridium polynesiense TaxID=1325933 RepID=UPI00058E8A3E|nr:ABC transporter substrate-binding protein [Clostridium polynesiense]
MKRISKNLIITFSLIFTLLLSACGTKPAEAPKDNNKPAASYPLTIKDSRGTEIKIEKEPEKIVSVAPNITEMIFALGKGDKLVGRTTYCDFPEEAKKVQDIGTLQKPDIEKIVELKPDLVIASTHFKEDVAKKFQELGIKVVSLYSDDKFDGVYESMNTLGKILNASEKSDEVVKGIKEKVQKVNEKVKDKKAPSVYYVVGFGNGGDFTSTGETYIHQMITMAGGDNIAKDTTGWKYSKEKLIEKNPEIIILPEYFKAEFLTTEGYKDLNAVKNNKVFVIDNNLLDRQGPRLAEGVEALAKIIHPEEFK